MSVTESNQTDGLTGLLTRAAFHEIFDAMLEKAKGTDNPIALAFIDIDNFFHINDQYGHTAGDIVLKDVAEAIRQTCGEDAIGVRYGGDEFVVIFPSIEREQAFLTLEKMRTEVSKKKFVFEQSGQSIDGIALSGGLTCYPMDGRLKSELIRKADQALYRAKVTGRGKIRLAYDEKMVPKTSHYTQTQLERLSKLAVERQVGEAELLREALDALLTKYGVNKIDRWG
jgi:diguanylate cyclase (GGDEF)-like protein